MPQRNPCSTSGVDASIFTARAPGRRWQARTSRSNPGSADRQSPACCLHVPGQAWIFINTTFGGALATTASVTARNACVERYGRTCPGSLQVECNPEYAPNSVPGSTAAPRRHCTAHAQGSRGSHRHRTREADRSVFDRRVGPPVPERRTCGQVSHGDLEQIHAALPQRPSLDPVRRLTARATDCNPPSRYPRRPPRPVAMDRRRAYLRPTSFERSEDHARRCVSPCTDDRWHRGACRPAVRGYRRRGDRHRHPFGRDRGHRRQERHHRGATEVGSHTSYSCRWASTRQNARRPARASRIS